MLPLAKLLYELQGLEAGRTRRPPWRTPPPGRARDAACSHPFSLPGRRERGRVGTAIGPGRTLRLYPGKWGRNLSSPPRCRSQPGPVVWGHSSGGFIINMEPAGPEAGERSSGLESPGSTDDRLFLVKGVVRWACGGRASSARALPALGGTVPVTRPGRNSPESPLEFKPGGPAAPVGPCSCRVEPPLVAGAGRGGWNWFREPFCELRFSHALCGFSLGLLFSLGFKCTVLGRMNCVLHCVLPTQEEVQSPSVTLYLIPLPFTTPHPPSVG